MGGKGSIQRLRRRKLTAALGAPAGRLIVFLPKDHRLPPNEYENATGITRAMPVPTSAGPWRCSVPSRNEIDPSLIF
jgi:hypothetical protein